MKKNEDLTEKMKFLFESGKTKEGETEEQRKERIKKVIEDKKKSPINVLGPDLFDLLFGRLDFQILIKNVKIYLEFNKIKRPDLNFPASFSTMLHLKEVSIAAVIFLFIDLA